MIRSIEMRCDWNGLLKITSAAATQIGDWLSAPPTLVRAGAGIALRVGFYFRVSFGAVNGKIFPNGGSYEASRSLRDEEPEAKKARPEGRAFSVLVGFGRHPSTSLRTSFKNSMP